jgi:uncharacterized membrane protein YhaH (DUF805 family)
LSGLSRLSVLSLSDRGANSATADTWATVFFFALLLSLFCYVAITVKRLHDLGRPGLEAAWLFVPIISIIVFVALCIVPGQPGPNRYGRRTNDLG